jgi:predicted helicase
VARADDGGLLAFFVPGLIEEAAEAERVKSDQQILVIVGNPPYSAASHNKQPEIERLFAAWKTIDGRAGSPQIREARIALNDDYLKFMRWAVWKLLEQPGAPGHGILAFVTNHGFVWNRLHRGVRKALLDAFDDIWVFNLHGNQRLWVRGRTDEKVFPDVQQGISMTVFVRRPGPKVGLAAVHYREMRGTRQAKYDAASTARLGGDGWATVTPEAPFWSFAPSGGDDRYATWPSIRTIFPRNNSGVKTERDDTLVDIDAQQLLGRAQSLTDLSLTPEDIVARTGVHEKNTWTVARRRGQFAPASSDRVLSLLYRLFDRRLIYWDPAMMGAPGVRFVRHLLPRPFGDGGDDRLALVVQRARPITTIATVTRGIASSDVTSYWCHVYPLRLADPSAEGQLFAADGGWRENLHEGIRSRLAAAYGRTVDVEAIAWYVFAVLSSPAYRRDYAAELSIDHPRIPFPTDAGVFATMAALGAELAAAHLMEAPVAADIRFEGEGTNRVDEARHDAATSAVWINATQRFTGVPEAAWAWGGAFRPLQHWLTDRRRRTLDLAQLEQYQRAIHAVREAIRLEPLLDEQLARVLAAPLKFGAAE